MVVVDDELGIMNIYICCNRHHNQRCEGVKRNYTTCLVSMWTVLISRVILPK